MQEEKGIQLGLASKRAWRTEVMSVDRAGVGNVAGKGERMV